MTAILSMSLRSNLLAKTGGCFDGRAPSRNDIVHNEICREKIPDIDFFVNRSIVIWSKKLFNGGNTLPGIIASAESYFVFTVPEPAGLGIPWRGKKLAVFGS